MDNQKTIRFATVTRGFMNHLFNNENIDARFMSTNKTFEAPNKLHLIGSHLIRTWLFNFLGVIQRISCGHESVDLYGSCNRFLKTDKPYFIYVENPTALYHYSLGKAKSFLGRRKIDSYLNDKNLKALIFWSDAAKTTFEKVCGKPNDGCIMKTIYPYIPKNNNVSEEQIKSKRERETVKFLYIAQGIRFLSKGALEVIEAFARLKEQKFNCHLTMITNLSAVSPDLKNKIDELGIDLFDFAFPYDKLEQIYADHDVFLQPTSDDSFGLTIMEAMKAGLCIIASKLFAIPEMVENEFNGFLVDPHFWFFGRDNIPNPEVWNNRKKTIYSGQRSECLTNDLYSLMSELIENRALLEKMSLNSFNKANSAPFNKQYITSQWNEVLNQI